MIEDDRNFIISAWLNSFRYSAFAAGVHLDAHNTVICPAAMVSKGRNLQRTNDERRIVNRTLSTGITDTVFFFEQRKLIESLLERATIDIMCSSDDPDIIVGWACTDVQDDIPIIHFIYVKKDFRGQGHARDLLAHRGINKGTRCFFTHQAPQVFDSAGVLASQWKDAWIRKSGWVFNPFILHYAQEKETTQENRE